MVSLPNTRPKLKSAFKKAKAIAPLYTGGPIAVSQDGTRLVTCVNEEPVLTDLTSGEELCRLASDGEDITSLCISPSAKYVAIFSSSLALRLYELPSEPSSKLLQPTRTIARAHDAPVHVCKVDPTSNFLASGAADGIVKVWDLVRGYVTHAFRGHGGVVSALAFNVPREASSVLAVDKIQLITGSVDTNIRIFDLNAATARSGSSKPQTVLQGHVSVPRGLDVSPDGKWLISGGRDSVVLLWDLSGSGETKTTKGKQKASESKTSAQPFKTIPILERVEAVGFLHVDETLPGTSSSAGQLRFYTGGEKGQLKIWDGRNGSTLLTLGRENTTISDDQEEQRQIVDATYLPLSSTLISVHADQNILFHALPTASLSRQLVGFNDEIVDAAFLSPSPSTPDSHLAVATNSSQIRVYSTSALDARLISGHKDVVLTLDRSAAGNILVSGSKDRSARIWAHGGPDDNPWTCVAVCDGHAESVGAIAMARKPGTDGGLTFMFTGSQDRTIKMWSLAGVSLTAVAGSSDAAPMKCKSLVTHKAHEKDINALDVSPNDRLLVSGSQDKTAKVFEVEYVMLGNGTTRAEFKHIGTCKGHKRGVWSVKFGRAERVLATGSGDKTVKLWNLDDFTCVKTFEGHTNSVLRVDFINQGMQLLSSASDGLVKLWNVRDEVCVASMDNHEDRIWALAVSADEKTVVSGAADSMITFWQDCSEEEEAEKEAKRVDLVEKEQDFLNYLALHDYRKAIILALSMQQPGRLLSLFRDVASHGNTSTSEPTQNGVNGAAVNGSTEEPPSITGSLAVDKVIQTLSPPDLARLLKYVREWNARARTSEVAQTVLHAILKLRTADDVAAAFGATANLLNALDDDAPATTAVENGGGKKKKDDATGLRDLIEGLIPYTERHLARMERLVQESYVVDYVLGEMDDGMFRDADDMEVDGV